MGETLERVGRMHGRPKVIRVDQGTEFMSRDLDPRACTHVVTFDLSRRAKSADNALIEPFNATFRAERLSAHRPMSLDDAWEKCEARRRNYDEVRRHSAIGSNQPISLIGPSRSQGPPWRKGAEISSSECCNVGGQFRRLIVSS